LNSNDLPEDKNARVQDLIVDKSGKVQWSRALSDGKRLRFLAEDVRQTNTGPHAKIVIGKDTTRLDSDVFNLGRRDQRNKLANDVHRKNFAEGGAITKEELQHELMLFCDAVYPALMMGSEPGLVYGNAGDNPITFLAGPHIIQGGGTIMFGPEGGGKSHTLMINSVAIDAGVNTFWDTKQAKVLLVNLERSPPSLERRLEGTNMALGLDPHRPLRILNARGKSLKDVKDSISKYVQEEGIEVVALDSLTRAGAGDLNENQTGNTFSDTMNSIAPTWFAIGHVGRKDKSHLFGSIMYDAAADIMVMFRSEERRAENVLGVRLDMTKANDVPKVNEFMLKYEFDNQGLINISRTTIKEFPDLSQDVRASGEGVLYDVIDYLKNNAEDGAATGTEIAQALEKRQSNINTLLTSNDEFVKIGKVPGKRGVFYGLASRS
jgi:hypothetical protein